MPIFLGICGVLEVLFGLMTLAGAPSRSHHLAGILLIGFGILTLGLGAVLYELQKFRRLQQRQTEASGHGSGADKQPTQLKSARSILARRG